MNHEINKIKDLLGLANKLTLTSRKCNISFDICLILTPTPLLEKNMYKTLDESFYQMNKGIFMIY